jgi:hypothetical protein
MLKTSVFSSEARPRLGAALPIFSSVLSVLSYWVLVWLVGWFSAGLGPSRLSAQVANYERPPIDYLRAEVNDPIARLNQRLASGEVSLAHDPRHGYLPAILEALDVPVSSQTLVFSKTSLQLQRISPRLPRALYFNDEVYVGYCQRGDVLEFGATDAWQGATFYTLEQSIDERPQFVRDQGSCLSCHASSRTQNVPGYLIRSVYPNGAGHPILGSGTYTTDHTSPFAERWGGWYVTGQHGDMRHMGNQVYAKNETRSADLEPGANVTALDAWIRPAAYLSPHSDLVALMVLEHQTQMHNALAAANYETRLALHQSNQMNALLDRPAESISDSAQRRIDAVVEQVVRQLLFCDEFVLTSPVSGTSSFTVDFAVRGPVDAQGRSLRQFDLQTRLFRYPCSYLIYSESFRQLPRVAHAAVVQRLTEVLTAASPVVGFEHLSDQDRRAILAILRGTHPDFAETTVVGQ